MPDTEYCCKQLCYFKTTLHTKQSNEVKVCIHTSKRGVSLCFSIYVCILWGVPMTEKFTSWRMKPEVYIQLILNNSGITTIFRINIDSIVTWIVTRPCGLTTGTNSDTIFFFHIDPTFYSLNVECPWVNTVNRYIGKSIIARKPITRCYKSQNWQRKIKLFSI
jgi:hypothetical protein